MEKLLTVSQVCELFQVSQALVYKWVHYGYLPVVKLGRVVRFEKSVIEKWINKREKKGRVNYKLVFDE